MDTKYFTEKIVGELEDVCYPEGRNRHETRISLVFDNAPIHNRRRAVMRQLEQSAFKRMEDPAKSPDLAPCDFFLFSNIREQLKGWSFAEKEEPSSVLPEPMNEILPDPILRVFADWNRRLRLSRLMKGEYVQ
jgi:hypothetical protein